LLEGLACKYVLADRGYDSNAIIESIENQGAQAVIPSKKNRLEQRDTDFFLYKDRHLVECLFNKLKGFRGVATRYAKLARNFLGNIHLASIYILLK
jgi:transposase